MQRAAESTVVGIVSGEFDRVTEVSDAFLRMVGYSRKELIAGDVNWPDLTPPEYSSLDDRAHDEDLMHGACTPFEKEYFRKDGSRVPVLVTSAVLVSLRFDGSLSFRILRIATGGRRLKKSIRMRPRSKTL